eukprot:8416688-Heterocapsa_arctica.AAC.1
MGSSEPDPFVMALHGVVETRIKVIDDDTGHMHREEKPSFAVRRHHVRILCDKRFDHDEHVGRGPAA